MSNKPKILVTRAIFPDQLAQLEKAFEVRSNQADQVFTPAELQKELSSVVGALVTGSERIDASALLNAKDLKIAANISVGYNNFDVPAMSSAGVMATNPATAPEAAPSMEALPRISASPTHQASTAAAVAPNVLMKASAAKPLASRFLATTSSERQAKLWRF